MISKINIVQNYSIPKTLRLWSTQIIHDIYAICIFKFQTPLRYIAIKELAVKNEENKLPRIIYIYVYVISQTHEAWLGSFSLCIDARPSIENLNFFLKSLSNVETKVR